MDICTDLQDGKLDGAYTQDQLNAFFSDPTVQGYCGPITVLVTPPVTPPTTTPPTTPPTSTPPTAPPAPIVCTETSGTSGSGGTAGTPGSPAPCAHSKPQVHVVPVLVTEVKGVSHTVVPTPAPRVASVRGTQHTVKTPAARQAAPVTVTKTKGSLPFTGAQLTLFLVVGLGLIATGLVLRTTARSPRNTE